MFLTKHKKRKSNIIYIRKLFVNNYVLVIGLQEKYKLFWIML